MQLSGASRLQDGTCEMLMHWAIWFCLSFIHLLGFLSVNGTTQPLRLNKDNSVEISVVRPLPDPLHLQAVFEKPSGVKRPELGEQGHTEVDGGFRFDNPGEPIKLLVSVDGTTTVFEMFPGGNLVFEDNNDKARRDFRPFLDDGDPAVFPWPPINHLRPLLPAGFSKVKITVLETGPITAGELITLYVEPPVSQKTVHTQAYLWLGWLMLLWPINLVLLFTYGAFCLRKTWQKSRKPGH